MKAPEDLANAEVVDESGNTVRVADLWRDRTTVIHFVRHFG